LNERSKVIIVSGVYIARCSVPTTVNCFRRTTGYFLITSYFPFSGTKATGNRLNILTTERTFALMLIIKKIEVFVSPLANNTTLIVGSAIGIGASS
jgi:hypothetical protein